MSYGEQRSPSLPNIIEMAIDKKLLDVHTCIPGKVEKYDATQQKADIKPLVKAPLFLDDDGDVEVEVESLPVIPDVPIGWPRGGGFFMSLPIEKGDFVLLVFAERSIDNYLAGSGSEVDPVVDNRFDLSDAVAIPGFAPFKRAIQGATDIGGNAIFGKESEGIQIQLTSSNTVEIRLNGSAPNHVAIYEILETFWTSFKTWLDAHTHSTGVGPSGPPASPSPNFDTGIKSTKVLIPQG